MIYIDPITKIHSSFAEAKEFYDKFGGLTFLDEKKRLPISDLARGKRNLIVGEPGIGKSLLLGEIKKYLDANNYTSEIITLRQTNSLDLIDVFLRTKIEGPKALLLDALDEVRSSLFPSVL